MEKLHVSRLGNTTLHVHYNEDEHLKQYLRAEALFNSHNKVEVYKGEIHSHLVLLKKTPGMETFFAANDFFDNWVCCIDYECSNAVTKLIHEIYHVVGFSPDKIGTNIRDGLDVIIDFLISRDFSNQLCSSKKTLYSQYLCNKEYVPDFRRYWIDKLIERDQENCHAVTSWIQKSIDKREVLFHEPNIF
ncbi:hypothetical protein [Vibrio splendidus]|uniref:hypothetical protein n=1 Tax=Vibrio splendidus TaxID=29497 RepID=UPI000C826B25|nr:hypothetical protein [Vibrio splendidus]MCQ8870184.1 hypothetical protein [Vibrio splendidus]PMG52585.1 hypothetical protein BCU88_22185 [Vibrio splendidus]